MNSDDPLHPTTRFSNRVADYVRARPRYPDSLVQLLETGIGLGRDTVIADVGSGTGLSAEPFLKRGNTVLCIEPNAAMRAAAETLLEHYPGFRSLAGSAERTGLEDGSVDCILVAQAFHWVDTVRARVEFRRILAADGWVCLLWNIRKTRGSAFLQGYEELLRRFGTDYDRVRHRTGRLASGEAMAGTELARFFGGRYERRILENGQDLDYESLKSRLRSSSYVPTEESPTYAPMMSELSELFKAAEHNGVVRMPYDLEVYYGRLS